jgi:hypothetical protein
MTGLAAHRSDCTSGLRSAQSRLPAGEKVGLKGVKTPFRRSGVDSAVSCGPSRPRGGRDGVILLGCSLSARARRYVLLVSRARDEVTTVKSLTTASEVTVREQPRPSGRR